MPSSLLLASMLAVPVEWTAPAGCPDAGVAQAEPTAGPLVAVDVSSIPSGGFVVSRHVGSLYYETVLPCTED